MDKVQLYGDFYFHEVGKSTTASRFEIDNEPDSEALANAYGLARHILQPVRDHFDRGFSPQSWFRCEELEYAICQKPFERWCKLCNVQPTAESWKTYFARKQHPLGGTADIEIAGISNDELFDFIRDNLEFDQLILEYAIPGKPYSGWVHVSWLHHGNRKQVKHIN